MIDLLFVYGTLRRAAGHPMHRLLERGAECLGPARLRGRLYDLGAYPAAVAEPAGPAVVGEVYRMRDPQALLAALDRYEGCTDPADGAVEYGAAEYRREPQRVTGDDGREMTAWIYLYNRSTAGLRPIAGGDYLRRQPGPQARRPPVDHRTR